MGVGNMVKEMIQNSIRSSVYNSRLFHIGASTWRQVFDSVRVPENITFIKHQIWSSINDDVWK